MTDKYIQDKFKELIYSFGNVKGDEIISQEGWNNFILEDKDFSEFQINEIRSWIKSLFDEITDKPEP